jgi:hypothetical protein
MTGCFSSIFSSRSSKKQRILYFESTKPSNGEELKSGMSAATPCYCIPPVGPVYSDSEDKPPVYTSSLAGDIFRPEVLKFIEKTVDGYSDELRKLSLKIHGMLYSMVTDIRPTFD